MTKAVTPSPVQAEALQRMAVDDGLIVRIPGGFWTTNSTPRRMGDHVPEWYVDIKTVRAMERRGWISRTNFFAEEWRDTRRLVR